MQDILIEILRHQLQLGSGVEEFNSDTPLLGVIPELDSMGVVNVITAIEENLECIIDDEINSEVFETIGSLNKFIETRKLSNKAH